MNDEMFPDSIILRNTAPGPTRCSCPMYSSSDFGRNRSANGSYTILLFFFLMGAKIITNRRGCKHNADLMRISVARLGWLHK